MKMTWKMRFILWLMDWTGAQQVKAQVRDLHLLALRESERAKLRHAELMGERTKQAMANDQRHIEVVNAIHARRCEVVNAIHARHIEVVNLLSAIEKRMVNQHVGAPVAYSDAILDWDTVQAIAHRQLEENPE